MKLPRWLRITTLLKVASGLFYALPKVDWKLRKRAPTKAEIKAQADKARSKIRNP